MNNPSNFSRKYYRQSCDFYTDNKVLYFIGKLMLYPRLISEDTNFVVKYGAYYR